MTKDPTDEDVTDYASVTSQYNYITEENVTTNLISSLNNTVNGENGLGSVNYSYTYDENGKITGITITSTVDGIGGTTQYIYDEAGQLIKETKGSDYVEYAYDSKGNISTRKKYSGNSLVSTDNFVYGADSWEDKLTGYNNKTIAYDSIGNPTSYLGATLTWRGRELASYEKGNKQISYSYDVDGMRYQKVVKTNGTETSRYDYVYSEGKLILITYTENGASDTARFIYDSMGEPRGFILNNTATYLYIKNAQGDITGIVNEDGDVILTCSYDAWGKVTFASTNMEYMALAAKLSKINPFTYRGYCYDYDIEMYYLQSRYYDPEICRFINADSTDYLGTTDTLLSYNLFAYCENEPVNRVDPKGTIGFEGDNPRDGTKSALRKFAKNILKYEKQIVVKITKESYGVYSGKITYRNKNNKKQKLKFVIGTKYKWRNLTNTTLNNNQEFASSLGWIVNDELLNILSTDVPPSSYAPLVIISVGAILLYFGSQNKYDNFNVIYNKVYGRKGLDRYNVYYYHLMRIEGVDKYEGWYAIPDSVGRVIKVQ